MFLKTAGPSELVEGVDGLVATADVLGEVGGAG
jgi:hypothetical protein